MIAFRPAVQNDEGFIADSWVRSYGDSRWARDHGPGYVRSHDAAVKRLFARAQVFVACLEAHPETIIGWACTEPDCVHYVYVKQKFRHEGLGKKLIAPYLQRRDVEYSHKPLYSDIKVPEGWTHNMYRFFVGG